MDTRRALIRDVLSIGKIVNDCAEYGLMLHRSLSYLYEHVRDFYVVEADGQIVGVCGLSIVWANLAEVCSLAVTPSHRGRGLGKQLVQACVQDAAHLGIGRLMTLTYEKDFFIACGFEPVERQQLPLKVWSECLRCSKNQACDEIAMIRVLAEVPTPSSPIPPPALPPHGRYEVPVPLGIDPVPSDRRPKMDEAPDPKTIHIDQP